RKLITESTQCLRCQRVGPFTKECKALTSTCARCAAAHPTWECTFDDRDLAAYRCSNCQPTGHRAEFRSCPIYARSIWVYCHKPLKAKYIGLPPTDPKMWRLWKQATYGRCPWLYGLMRPIHPPLLTILLTIPI
ncbi:hypothetical protein BDQ12DRAFT_617930, partial [Crucibulum laeve]